ncbi:MAG: hypothetical protein ACK5UI_09585 [Bacteroidota bacterium]
MKLLRLFSCLLLLQVPVFAQTVEWGNQQKFRSKTNYSQVLGENSSGLFVARSKFNDFRYDILVEKYKSNLALETTKELFQPNGSKLERLIVTESGLNEFVSQKNATTGKYDLVITLIDNALNHGTPTVLLSYDPAALGAEEKILIRPSSDKKVYAVTYVTQGAEKGKSILHLYTFDASFKPMYNRRFGLPSGFNEVVLINAEVDNKGNAFILLDQPKPNTKKEVRKVLLYGYYQQTDQMLEYEISNDSLFVNEAALVVNNLNKKVNVAGFYSDKNDDRCLGSLFYKIDIESTQVDTFTVDVFDIGFISKSTNTITSGQPVLSDLYIRKLLPNNEGGVTIIAEKYYETKQTYTYNLNGFPQTGYRSVFHYDEIILVTKNGNGTTRNKQAIKKSQTSMSDGGYYSSFVIATANDKIALVYNEDVTDEGDVIMATYSNKGGLESKVLIKAMSYYVSIMPFESKQVNASSIIIPTLKDKRFCLMRLTF